MVKLVVIRPSIKRRTRETTDGQTGGDEAFNKKTGTRETTDGHTGGDEAFNKKTGTAETTDGQTGVKALQ
jgi:hypothetical protein